MEGRQEVERGNEFTEIVDLIIERNAAGCEPITVLKELLEKYLEKKPDCSTSLFAEIPDMKLVKAMLVLLKAREGDPMLTLIWHLNSISQRIQPHWPIVQLLSAYFAINQQYGVHLDEVCTQLFESRDVWQDRQQHYFNKIFVDLQNPSEAISLAAFEVLLALRFFIPPKQRSILVNMININLEVTAGKPFKLVILKHAKLIHEWFTLDTVPQKIFLENLLKNIYTEDRELCTAACTAVVDLQHFIDKKLLVASLNKIIDKIKHTFTNWFLMRACDVLTLLSSIVPHDQCMEIVTQLLLKIDCLDDDTVDSARKTLWKFLSYIPLENRIKITDDCLKGLESEEDAVFLTTSSILKFLDHAIPFHQRFKIVDALCKNLNQTTASTVRRVAALECFSGIMNSIPVNLYSEVIAQICDIAIDKNLPGNLRQQAIYTLKKLC